jgi:hypothetical protein
MIEVLGWHNHLRLPLLAREGGHADLRGPESVVLRG